MATSNIIIRFSTLKRARTRCMMGRANCVRSKNAQKQLERTSLKAVLQETTCNDDFSRNIVARKIQHRVVSFRTQVKNSQHAAESNAARKIVPVIMSHGVRFFAQKCCGQIVVASCPV